MGRVDGVPMTPLHNAHPAASFPVDAGPLFFSVPVSDDALCERALDADKSRVQSGMWRDALRLHGTCAVAFACLYYAQDAFTTKHPRLSERLCLVQSADRVETCPNTLLYYVWFSCITQSTIGYSGLLDEETGNIVPFSKINSNAYVVLNIAHMLCVFALSGVLLQKVSEGKKGNAP